MPADRIMSVVVGRAGTYLSSVSFPDTDSTVAGGDRGAISPLQHAEGLGTCVTVMTAGGGSAGSAVSVRG